MSHRLTELRERLAMETVVERRDAPSVWRWLRLKSSDTSKRSHLVRLEAGWWMSLCGLRLCTHPDRLAEDAEWKCRHCTKRKGRE